MSKSPLKVYDWTGVGRGPARQTRCVMAARSWRAVSEASGLTVGYLRSYGSVTGNDQEVAAALARPGVVLWRSLNDRGGEFKEWT